MRKPIILIAEATFDLHQKLRTLLSPNGFRIIEANGKEKILKTLQKNNPDLHFWIPTGTRAQLPRNSTGPG